MATGFDIHDSSSTIRIERLPVEEAAGFTKTPDPSINDQVLASETGLAGRTEDNLRQTHPPIIKNQDTTSEREITRNEDLDNIDQGTLLSTSTLLSNHQDENNATDLPPQPPSITAHNRSNVNVDTVLPAEANIIAQTVMNGPSVRRKNQPNGTHTQRQDSGIINAATVIGSPASTVMTFKQRKQTVAKGKNRSKKSKKGKKISWHQQKKARENKRRAQVLSQMANEAQKQVDNQLQAEEQVETDAQAPADMKATPDHRNTIREVLLIQEQSQDPDGDSIENVTRRNDVSLAEELANNTRTYQPLDDTDTSYRLESGHYIYGPTELSRAENFRVHIKQEHDGSETVRLDLVSAHALITPRCAVRNERMETTTILPFVGNNTLPCKWRLEVGRELLVIY